VATLRSLCEHLTCCNSTLAVTRGLTVRLVLCSFNDADLDKAVAGTIASKFRNAGQTCVCANRIFVQSKIYPAFAERLTQSVRAMKIGDGLAKGVVCGPLINTAAIKKVSDQVSDALRKGGTLLCGGDVPTAEQLAGEANTKGFFYAPTVVGNATRVRHTTTTNNNCLDG
jgi:succinate-semialdehyde dehydrogenase/glutarate-semialdehyde dehydrogenase